MNEPNDLIPKTDQASASHDIDTNLAEVILEAVHEEDAEHLTAIIAPLHPADIAEFITTLAADDRKAFIKLLGKQFNPEVLLELNTELREEAIESLGTQDSATAITKLDTDDAVSIIEDLEKEDQQEILDVIPHDIRAELEEGLSYPEESAGRLMQKRFVAVPEYWTVGQVIDFLRSDNEEIPDDFYEIFVVDPKYHPIGTVLVSRIIRQQRATIMREMMNTSLRIIDTKMDQEDVAYIFHKYGLASAPVVNDSGRLVGLLSIDDIVEIIEEEAEEDILHMGGVSETDINASAFATAWRRFPWLVVNILTAITVSFVIGIFEDTISSLVALAILMPIVASISGNTGTQAATVAVRAIATKELTSANALRIIFKEVTVGALNGCVLAIFTGLTVWLRFHDIHLSLVFSGAMIFALIMGGFVGSLIPLGLVRVGVDPAIATGVFLTGVTDMVSFSSFLGLATLFLL